MDCLEGFLNLNKPAGVTSHDCVARLRRWLGVKKVGHGGTLDPMATGVLPLAVGRATRLLPYLPTAKTYAAVIRFGLTTSTDDREGAVLTEAGAAELTLAAVAARLPEFLGVIDQVPPAYSALQVGGQRLYDLARRGQVVTPAARSVTIHRLEVTGWQSGPYPELSLTIDCGPGTYIRSLARDLGQRLGPGATLAALQRTHSGGFDLADSLPLAAVQDQLAPLPLVPATTALQHLPAICLDPELAHRWRLGQKIPSPQPQPLGVPHRVLAAPDQTLLGVGENQEREGVIILKAKMVLAPGNGRQIS
jgi:tRNA pseudouridine55 synthase